MKISGTFIADLEEWEEDRYVNILPCGFSDAEAKIKTSGGSIPVAIVKIMPRKYF